tara:strand:- start:240 stop:851 length:612 start_codon:yes stop_codon:yes gene_type:complete
MVDEKTDDRKIKDMKGYDSRVGERDQYAMRSSPHHGRKNYPWTLATKFCDIPPDVYREILQEAKSATYEPYFAFNFAYVTHPWALEIVEKYDEIYGCLFLKIDGGADVLPHCDPVRASSIIAPMCYEDEVYTPLEIYSDETIYSIGKTEAGSAWAWNCRQPHAVFNQRHDDRVNLQFNISVSYREFYEKHLNPEPRIKFETPK